MDNPPTIHWFRQDLRLADNRALRAAVEAGGPVIAVYIREDAEAAAPDAHSLAAWPIGAASRWWLGKSLASLAANLEKRGTRLILRSGFAPEVLVKLARETGAKAVHFTRSYEPRAAATEQEVKAALDEFGVTCRRFAGSAMYEPEQIRTGQGGTYKVFTPFYRACLADGPPARPMPAPKTLPPPATWPKSEKLSNWRLAPSKPDWSGGLAAAWAPGEVGAHALAVDFVDGPMANYAELRNRPDQRGSSRLSPHLHFGEISPHQAWQMAAHAADARPELRQGATAFQRELIWREFSLHLLHHWPDLPQSSFRPEFEAYPWRSDAAALKAWQMGRTGYPIVDAGMRELWQTGWMHNRVRMIVASFLIKDLLIDWRHGQAWFWDTLVDADLANNAASWQWVAGSGADAAPYFRIFNPISQGRKFDPAGAYVRHYVPELAGLPDAHIHAPFEAPAGDLAMAGVKLGKTYPPPIVDHAKARLAALAGYDRVKAAREAT